MRQAAGAQGVKLVCSERKSQGSDLYITNGFKDRKIYPVVTGVNCDAWSGTGNPGYMNGEEIQPGQTLKLHLKVATVRPNFSDAGRSRIWTMDVGQGTVGYLDAPVPVSLYSACCEAHRTELLQPNGDYDCKAIKVPDPRGGFIRLSPSCKYPATITISPD